MDSAGEPGLIGRRRELELAQRVALPGGPGCVLIVGDAGIGKTSVWLAALEHVREQGLSVRVARAAEAESAFAFAVLGDLLADVDEDKLAALPAPQRRALEAALLLREEGDDTPTPYAVAVASLGVLRQEEPGVVIAVDDVQWVDPASAVVLEYIVRRVDRGGIKFLLTERSDTRGSFDSGGLPVERISLEGLTFGATQHLLTQRFGPGLPRPLVRHIHETSGGNPFFALELGAAVRAAGNAEEKTPPLPRTLLELIGERLRGLSPGAEQAVLAVALGAELSRERLRTMLADDSGVDEAIAAEALVGVAGRVRLAHPLIGSAVLERASEADRRDLSARLAETADSAEERAHHQARVAVPPSDEMALDLESASGQAQRRGALDRAAELAEEGARFAEDDDIRGRLLLRASQLHLDAGDHAAAARTAEAALAVFPSGPERGRACLLRADSCHGDEALDWNSRALEHVRSDTSLYARAVAGRLALMSVDFVSGLAEAELLAQEAVDLVKTTGDPGLVAFVCIEACWPLALRGKDIESLLERAAPHDRLFNDPVRMRGIRAMWRGEISLARECFRDGLARAGDWGEVWAEFIFLHHLAELAVRVGDASELERVLGELDVHPAGAMATAGRTRGRAFLAALHGDAPTAAALVEHLAANPHLRWQRLEATRARGLAHLFAGDAASAATDLGSVAQSVRDGEILEPGAFPASPDLIEALVRSGRADEAWQELEWLEDRAREQDHRWALAVSARARGLLEEDAGALAEAEAALRESLERHEDLELPLDEARAQLALGRVLRRTGRRRDARALLSEVSERLQRLGVAPLAAAARDELASLGGRASSPGLTPTEERVARLVAEGLTNREVAAKLVVTVRAVEANLTRVYAKLGVRSRAQLARIFRADA